MPVSVVVSSSVSSPKTVGTGPDTQPNGAHLTNIDTQAVELDARVLARECLKEIGREMGVAR